MKLSLLVPFGFFMTTSLLPAKDAGTHATPALPSNNAQVFTLDDGLTIIVEEDHNAPVASVQAWCGTGSIDEAEWMGAGLSHILEHMLFKGTVKRGPGEIAREVQEQGGYINAYTSFDRTVFWIDVPSTGASEAVDILADAMMHATLPEQEYNKEQEVIRREFAMGFDDPDRQSSLLMLRTVFSQSPFRHPVIGYMDIYNKLTREDVLAYYKKRYVPNNITFVIVGDVDAQKIHAQLAELFKDAPRKALDPVYIATEPVQAGRRDAHAEFPTELTRLSLAWRVPGLTDPDTPALDLLGTVLGSGRSSMLNEQLREKQQLVHSVAAGMYSLQTDGVFILQALCDPDKRQAAEDAMLAQIELVKKNGVTQAELDKARRLALSSQISALTTTRGKASDLGSNWLLTRNLNFSKDYLDAVARVTPADLQRVAKEYLRTSHLNVTSLNPLRAPAQAATEAAIAPHSEVKKFTLSNGLRLLVKEDPRLPLVSMSAVFRGGLLAETPEKSGLTKLFSRVLLKGTTTRSANQIAEQIEGAGGDIDTDSGNNSFSVSVDVLKPDLALGLNLLADVIEHPTFPKEEVELEKGAQLAGLKAEEEQPTLVARYAMRQKLFGTHPYALRSNGTPDSVAHLSADDLKAFHDQYAVAKNGVLAVFGDVKAEEVLKLVEKEFGSLPAGELGLTKAVAPTKPTQPVNDTVERSKQQAIVMIGYPGADLTSPDRPALEIINQASNDLGSRFFNRIREQLGLAYFVGAGNFNGLVPGAFIFYLGTDPKKVDRVTTEFQDEINKVAQAGLTDEEISRAKKKLLGAEVIRNQSNASFAASVAADEVMGLGFDNYLHRTEEIEKVTPEQIKEVSAKYFGTPDRVEVIVRPPAQTADAMPAKPQS